MENEHETEKEKEEEIQKTENKEKLDEEEKEVMEEISKEGKEEAEEKIEKRKQELKEKISSWLKNPYNLTLAAILIFAFAIRLYYFFLTRNQPIWWDEGDYLSTAKYYAFGFDFNVPIQRPVLFSFLSALIYLTGFGEITIKLFLVITPSVFLIFCIYLLAKEMYGKRTALIAAFLSSVSWTFLFWTARFQPDFFSLSFQILSIFFIWKYWKNKKSILPILAGIFAALGLHFKVSALLIPLIFTIFIFMKEGFSALKNKYYYFSALAFLLTLLPYFVWSQITFGTPVGFTSGYSAEIGSPRPYAWYVITFLYKLTENFLFFLFLIGLLVSLNFMLYLDIFLKKRKRFFNPNVFSILTIIVVLSFYIFYIKGAEDRHLYLMIPFLFFIVGKGYLFLHEKFKKYHKFLPILVLMILLAGAYYQLKHADLSIKGKKDSYMPVREAALWMKENSNEEDTIMSVSYTQTVYYSERKVYSYPEKMTQEEFESFILEKKPKYLVVSVFEVHHPKWMYQMPEKYFQILQPVKIYQMNNQPVLIVYEFKGYELSEQITQPIQSITTNQTTNQTINRSE